MDCVGPHEGRVDGGKAIYEPAGGYPLTFTRKRSRGKRPQWRRRRQATLEDPHARARLWSVRVAQVCRDGIGRRLAPYRRGVVRVVEVLHPGDEAASPMVAGPLGDASRGRVAERGVGERSCERDPDRGEKQDRDGEPARERMTAGQAATLPALPAGRACLRLKAALCSRLCLVAADEERPGATRKAWPIRHMPCRTLARAHLLMADLARDMGR